MSNKVEPLWPEQVGGSEVPAAPPARHTCPKAAWGLMARSAFPARFRDCPGTLG